MFKWYIFCETDKLFRAPSCLLVQPRRKTTTVGLKTVSYLGAKLWNNKSVLCNELWNEDFLTFKHIINDSNLDIIIYDQFQYLWKATSVLVILICLLTTLLFYPSSSFKTCSIFELWMIYETFLTTFHWLCHIYVYVYILMYIYIHIYIYIYSFSIVAYIIMFSVYMYISALYFLFAPGSYISHWLIFLL